MHQKDRDEFYAIELAIKSGDTACARELLRDALRVRPSAHAWYLSALVTNDPQQREQRLHKALQYDPNHEAARQALNSLSRLETTPAYNGFLTRLRHWRG